MRTQEQVGKWRSRRPPTLAWLGLRPMSDAMLDTSMGRRNSWLARAPLLRTSPCGCATNDPQARGSFLGRGGYYSLCQT